MNTLPKKPVYDGAELIGEAATKGEVEKLLMARGVPSRQAHTAVMTRCVEAPKGFHIITAGPIEKMMDELRAIR